MLEGSLTTMDPRLQRLVTRLQETQSWRERWDERGRQDGETWAVEVAGKDELREAHDEWDQYEGWDEDWEEMSEDDLPSVPTSFDLQQALSRWLAEDREAGRGSGMRVGEKMAYLAGWFDAVGHLWQAAEPLLDRSRER